MGIPVFGRVSSSVSAPRSGGVRTGGTTRGPTTRTLRGRSPSRTRRSTYSRSRRLPRRRSTGTTAGAPRPITRPSRRVLSRGSRFLRGPSDEDAARLSRRGRPADDRVRDGARRAERDGTTGQRKELRAVPGGRRGLPSVGGATDRDDDKTGRDRERGQRCRYRDGSRRGRRGGGRRSRQDSGNRTCSRRGSWIARRGGDRREQRAGRRHPGAAPLRHDLHAVHVRQGQPDSDGPRLFPVDVRGATRRPAAPPPPPPPPTPAPPPPPPLAVA